MKHLFYCSVVVILLLLGSCSGFSKYGIDEKPVVIINDDLIGIWKSTEDSNKTNYLVLSSHKKAFQYLVGKEIGIEEYIKRKSVAESDNYLVESYKNSRFVYYIGYVNAGKGENVYKNFDAYMSLVAGDTFLNIPYWDRKDTDPFDDDDNGYLLVRFLKQTKDRMSISIVSDPSMKDLSSSAAVREKIKKNLNNRNFYKDTIHLYKVKSGDFDLDETVKLYKAGQLTP